MLLWEKQQLLQKLSSAICENTKLILMEVLQHRSHMYKNYPLRSPIYIYVCVRVRESNVYLLMVSVR